jgi:hypothetical protein
MITDKGLIQLGFNPLDDFVLQDDGSGSYIKEWNSNKPKPTTTDIEAAHTEWQTQYDAQDYSRKRLEKYPSIEELTVALWEGVVEERMQAVTQLEIKRQAVKAKYPK